MSCSLIAGFRDSQLSCEGCRGVYVCVCVCVGGGGGGGGGVAGDTGEGEDEWIDPSLMSVLMGEDGGPLLVRAWEGWDQR